MTEIGTLGSTSAFGTMASDVLKSSRIQLEALSKRIQSNVEGVDDDTIETWKSNMLKLANDLDSASYIVDTSRQYFNSEEFRAKRSKLGSSGQTMTLSTSTTTAAAAAEENIISYQDLENTFNDAVSKKVKTFNTNHGPMTEKMKTIFKIAGTKKNKKDSDEFEIIETGESESDFICPFSGDIMKEPMTNGKCIHRISKASLDVMLKNKNTCNCAVAGCQAKWTKQNAVPDQEFEYRLQRFLRLKKAQTHSSSSSAVDIDQADDDDDDM